MDFIIRNKKKFLLGFSILICLACLVNVICILAIQIEQIVNMDDALSKLDYNNPMYEVQYDAFIGLVADFVISLIGYTLGLLFGLLSILFIRREDLNKMNIAYMFSVVVICLTYAVLGTRVYAMSKEGQTSLIPSEQTAAMVLGYIGLVFGLAACFIPNRINKWIRFALYGFSFLWLMSCASATLSFYSKANSLSVALPDDIKAQLIGATFSEVLTLLVGLFGIPFSYLLIVEDYYGLPSISSSDDEEEVKADSKTVTQREHNNVSRPTKIDPVQRLKDIKELLDLDILTKEEFDQVKKRYLDLL